MSSRRFVAVAATLAIVAMYFVPGALSQRIVTTNADAKLLDQGFAALQRLLPRVVLAPRVRRGGTIVGAGGLRSRYECVRIVRGVKGPRRWLCLSLKPDGSAGAVAWIAPRPTAADAVVIIDDGDQSTQPNP